MSMHVIDLYDYHCVIDFVSNDDNFTFNEDNLHIVYYDDIIHVTHVCDDF